jgi:hypothetical protein
MAKEFLHSKDTKRWRIVSLYWEPGALSQTKLGCAINIKAKSGEANSVDGKLIGRQ